MTDARRRMRRVLARVPGALTIARLTVVTTRICLRYRVTGLASEAGFFALLSLPPLVLGLFGGLGYLGNALGPATVDEVRADILRYAARFLTTPVIDSVLGPTVNDVLRTGRADLLSIGFVLSLWSGSRALNVFVDTISIMYGQSGVRGIVPTRALSFSLYVVALVLGIVTIPLVLLGPSIIQGWLPQHLDGLVLLYWPLVTVLTVGGLTSLYHVSTPRRSPWTRDVPGAVLTLVIWALASRVVQGSLAASLGGSSIYGPLSAPIVLLIWLYALAIAVLIGAALNAAIREMWPHDERRALHTRFLHWLRDLRERRSGVVPQPVWGDPFEGYARSAALHDELDLRSLREAANRPLTPLASNGSGRDEAPAPETVSAAESDR
ncbi:YihY/virulence factor BrkB family protein [Phycicoccus flavus]|uniref:YihY/virulence factor BrkB family protein n=1 Tax=Phycicoccus flavus TaxID=2502783 RepID=UPI000FEBAB07|nr:YihY/virulence factor BrkB family protein [Phycicoccus flavus]NHA67687.1 YihY/virulence factor BrkB family protein [Phycicoccus flavus]